MKKYFKIALSVLVLVFLCNIIITKNTYARPSTSALVTKTYVNAMGKCSNNVFFIDQFDLFNLAGFDSLTTGNGTAKIGTPNGLVDGIEASIDCNSLFNGHIPGTSKVPNNSNDKQAAKDALESIGYTGDKETIAASEKCGKLSYRDSDNSIQSTEICFAVESDDSIDSGELSKRDDLVNSNARVALYYGNCGGVTRSMCLRYYDSNENRYDIYDTGRSSLYTTWAEVEADIQKAGRFLGSLSDNNIDGYALQYRDVQYTLSSPENPGNIPKSYRYGKDVGENASKLVGYFGGYGSWGEAAFTDQEKYWFYADILDNFYGVSYDNTSCQVVKTDGAIPMKTQDGGLRWCKVGSASKNMNASVNIFADGDVHYLDKTTDINGVIAAFGSLDLFKVSEYKVINEETGAIDDPDIESDPVDGEVGDATDACYGSLGTLGLGWILCPILAGTSNGLNYLYGEIEQNYLAVKPSFFSTDNSTYNAWHTFQNVANIILVIFLLVVIFSQLTGIGIDNYGIKKILPRLIICAILINLSYFIAQFLVDVSNIIGNSIRGLFEGVDPGVLGDASSVDSANIPSNILGIAVGAAGAAGVAWITTALANPAMLLTLLLAIISGLFAVLMMWLILIARQAGVIIAVVVAPVAFALYLLPNTSKFTKSWGNLMKSLLLLYPLAGLLIGASFFVSNLMVGGSDGHPNGDMILPAMILRVAPFFALPTLFKKSIDAMGNLGTKIQGFSRGLSRGTTGAMRKAEWYKNAQELGRERQLTRRAGYNTDGTERNDIFARIRRRADESAVGRGLGWQRSRRSATEAYIKAQNERQKDEYLGNKDNISATLLGQEAKWEKEQVENQGVLLDKGMMTSIDGGGNFLGQNDPESVKNELIKRLSQSPEEQAKHYAENMALWKKLQSFKDKGYDKTAELWDAAEITDSDSRMMQQIKADVAANGDFKNGARTAYDIITSSGDRRAGAVATARGSGASLANLRMERIPDFSGAELNALSAVAQGQQYVDADGNLQTPSIDRQMQASELLLDALSDSQVRRRFKGADADVARQGAVSAFMNNFDKYTSNKDIEETYVSKNDPSRKFTYKRSQQGFLYDENRRNIINEDRLSRLTNRVTA